MALAAPVTPSAPTSRPRPGLRIGLGAVLALASGGLAVAALLAPFLEIRSGARTFAVYGAEESSHLHLVLVAVGILGALAALAYAANRGALRLTFIGVGGIALFFTALLLAEALHSVRFGLVHDLRVFRALGPQPIEVGIGPGLWACLAAGLVIGLGGVAVAVLGRPPRPAATGRMRR
jgi:hypothetical protein